MSSNSPLADLKLSQPLFLDLASLVEKNRCPADADFELMGGCLCDQMALAQARGSLWALKEEEQTQPDFRSMMLLTRPTYHSLITRTQAGVWEPIDRTLECE